MNKYLDQSFIADLFDALLKTLCSEFENKVQSIKIIVLIGNAAGKTKYTIVSTILGLYTNIKDNNNWDVSLKRMDQFVVLTTTSRASLEPTKTQEDVTEVHILHLDGTRYKNQPCGGRKRVISSQYHGHQ